MQTFEEKVKSIDSITFIYTDLNIHTGNTLFV